MTRTRSRTRPTAATLLAGSLLLFPLAACSDAPVEDEGAGTTSEAPADDTGTGAAEDTGGETAASPAEVDCSGQSCELTLQSGQEADVLGTTLAFTSSEDGTATIRVGNDDATCREGEGIEAGPLSLECTTVTEDSVTLTATLG